MTIDYGYDNHDYYLDHLHHLDHDDHLEDDDHLDHDELMTISVRKLEVVHKEVGGCTQRSWRLSDQIRITASIAQIDNHGSLTHSVTQEGRYRAARAAKKAQLGPITNSG